MKLRGIVSNYNRIVSQQTLALVNMVQPNQVKNGDFGCRNAKYGILIQAINVRWLFLWRLVYVLLPSSSSYSQARNTHVC